MRIIVCLMRFELLEPRSPLASRFVRLHIYYDCIKLLDTASDELLVFPMFEKDHRNIPYDVTQVY